MPTFNKFKLFSFFILISALVIFNYSCKDDSDIVNPGGDDDTEEFFITLTAPAGSDTLTVGEPYSIRWETNIAGEVKIEFTDDNGQNWGVITESTANDGLYIWNPVPDSVSSSCRIRISSVEDNTVGDISEDNFMIYKSTVRTLNLIKPNGGEFLFAGDSYTITWSSNELSQVKLEFSSNGGSTWNIIAPNFPADSGWFNWSPIPNLTSVNCLIRISDVQSDTLFDVSSLAFAIGQPQTISVISPNGGEKWPAKSGQVITWYASQVVAVKIEYSSNNGIDWVTIAENTESDGYYNWDPLPSIPSTNAKIRITDTEDGFPSDASDSVFTVSPEEALSIVQPNGGEQWLSGSSQYIRWNGSGPGNIGSKKPAGLNKFIGDTKKSPALMAQISAVRLEYTTNSGASWNLIAEDVENNGTYLWSGLPSANSSLCKVRISDMEDGVPFDISDSSFTIYNTILQEISVTSPNGGEVLEAGTTQNITWTSEGISSVKIEYTINNGLNWTTLINSTPSDGFYTWNQIPGTSSTNCRVRVSDADDGFPSDFSNATFTIAPEPGIEVISPNGGESMQAKSTTNIRWTSINISDVKIEYTTNNGAAWKLITGSTPSNGQFEWTVPDSVNSLLCKIRISDAEDNQPNDISDNSFAITDQVVQTITLLSPNGGEVWETGTTHDIAWTATGISKVNVDYTTNNGATWKPIVSNVESSGSVEWSFPADSLPQEANSIQTRIRVSDASDMTPFDVSNGTFTIKRIQAIRVIYPNGGESKIAGDTVKIQWYATGIEKVKIEFTTSNSIQEQSWYVLATDIPSGGALGSVVTSFSVPTAECRIRISDAEDERPIDYSDGIFMVAPQPVRNITVVSPNGGENWLVSRPGQEYSYEIRWTSTNVEKVDIEYSLDAGSVWKSIAKEVPSNGLYNWVTPSNINNRSDLCRVRIKSSTDSLLYDLTDEFFSLHPSSKLLRVLFPNGGEIVNPETRPDTVIQWVTAGISNVNIELSLDNGTTWQNIAANVQSTGAYRWVLPNIDVVSRNARIRVTDASDPDYNDMSDSYFSLNIFEPGLIIINPPKSIKAGTGAIQWRGSKDIKQVKIEYSADNGRTWKIIADRVTNNPGINKYQWKSVPENIKGKVLIRISDIGGKYSKTSDKFRIDR